jgi:hypothetical protein
LMMSGFSTLTLAAITRLSVRQDSAIRSQSVSTRLMWHQSCQCLKLTSSSSVCPLQSPPHVRHNPMDQVSPRS